MFSRRHYNAIAEVLRIQYQRELRKAAALGVSGPYERADAVARVIEEMSDMFARNNPAFSPSRFSGAAYNG